MRYLVTSPSGDRWTFGSPEAVVAWYSQRPPSGVLRITKVGLCEEVLGSTLPRSSASSEGPTASTTDSRRLLSRASVGPSIIEGEAS